MSAALHKYLRRMWRAQLSADALLTLSEAAEAMPGSPRLAREWLPEHVAPAAEILGQPLYRWGDVQDALRAGCAVPGDPAWLSTGEAAARLGVSRSTLDAMVARAPRDLPGAPVRVGEGGRRQHLRWDAGRIAEWAAAYRAWDARENGPSASRRRSAPSRPRAAVEEGAVDWVAVARAARRG